MSWMGRVRRWLGLDSPADDKREPAAVQAPTVPPPRAHVTAEVKPRESPKARLFHLGVDFGTCWSKIVMRDYQAPEPRAYVIRTDGGGGVPGDYRIPSAVVEHCGKLYFGYEGQQLATGGTAVVIRSPKMLVADLYVGPEPELPRGVDAEGLCSLVVAYLLQLGVRRAREYCVSHMSGTSPRITMTIGAPMASIDDEVIRARFVAVARNAFAIWQEASVNLTAGITLDAAQAIVSRARERVASREVRDPREWVRSEAEAGLLWAFQSPDVGEGLYACVDVGAGTTDVSFFRIRARFENGRWAKSGMVFYSATSGTPGVDLIDQVLAEFTGQSARPDLLRGREADVLRQIDGVATRGVDEASRAMHRVYQSGWREAYAKEQVQSAWDDYSLFVLGGGSRIPTVTRHLEATPWQQLPNRRIASPGFPVDLFELPSLRNRAPQPFNEDATFLLVAYGLSWLGADVPPVTAPNEVPPWRPRAVRRELLDQDELYPR